MSLRRIAYRLTIALIFAIPWENTVESAQLGTVSKALGLASAGAWGLAVVTTGSMRSPLSFHKTLFILVSWIGLTMYWSLNPGSSVAGFVTPGTRVDVLLTVTPRGAPEPVTQVIMQNIEALAAGQVIQRDEDGTPMVVSVLTVLVTPEQAEELAMAAGQGRIQLALRNYMDLEEVVTEGSRMSELMGTVRARPRRTVVSGSQPDPGGIIEFYRAGVRTLISY